MSHLSPENLAALLDGALDDAARRDAERHLESCDQCRAALAGWAAQDQALAGALDHEPGEAYFDAFADRVTARIRSEATAPVRSRAREAAGAWSRALLSPRGLAFAGSAAAVLVVGLLAYEQRDARAPLAGRELGGRLGQQATPTPEGAAAPGLKNTRAPAPAAALRADDAPGQNAATEPVANDELKDLPARRNTAREASRAEAPSADGGAPAGAIVVPRAEPVPASPTGPPTGPSSTTTLSEAEVHAQGQRAPLQGAEDARRRDVAPTSSNELSEPELMLKPGDALNRAADAVKEQERLSSAKRSASSYVGIAPRGFVAPPPPATLKSMQGAWGEVSEFSGWPIQLRALAQRADSLSGRARETREAEPHEVAAGAWRRLRAVATPGSTADLEARCRIADECHAAWSIAPTPARAASARAAIVPVLELAPAGARRQHYVALLSIIH